MRVTLSAAVTADGFLDDNGPERLIISTPEDWAEVLALRSRCDAILVGAETLRRDNPALLLRDEAARERRRQAGKRPDITKVTLSRSGRLDPSLRFFTEGEADKIVFSETKNADIDQIAEVIESDGSYTAVQIVTELEKRGIEHLLVEGGAQILSMFLREGVVDEVRMAVNPCLTLGPERGRTPFRFVPPQGAMPRREQLGKMVVTTWTIRPDRSAEELVWLRRAVEEGYKCRPCPTCYCVGAVIVTADGSVFSGYTHETSPTHHAEQEALEKALESGASLAGATIYSSMEPCSKRASEPESCSQLLIRHGFARAVFALYEPSRFVCCRGARNMREQGLEVRAYPQLAHEVLDANRHLKG